MSVPKKDGGVVTLHLRDARVLVRLEILVELLVVADEDEAVARDEDRFRVILVVVDQVRTAGSRPVVLCASNLTPSSRSFDLDSGQETQGSKKGQIIAPPMCVGVRVRVVEELQGLVFYARVVTRRWRLRSQ